MVFIERPLTPEENVPVHVKRSEDLLAATAAFSDITDTPCRALVDADRHVQTDVLSTVLPTGAATEATLSTRASESTLSGIKVKTDRLSFDTADRLAIQNPPALDTVLSTRASESTLTTLSGKVTKCDTDNITVISSALPTGAATESGVAAAMTSFADATGTRKLGLVDADRHPQIDVLSLPLPAGAATESTLAGIKGQTDKLTFDVANRLAIQNPPNLDTALSTRATETTAAAIKSKTDNLDVALSTRATESTLATRATEGTLARTDVESAVGVFSKRIDIRYDNVGLAKSADISATQPRNITQVSGTVQTARNWSADFEKLQNLNVLLSDVVASKTAFADGLGVRQLALVDADRHAQTDVLSSALPSGAATDATVAAAMTSFADATGTRKLGLVDADGHVQVDMMSIPLSSGKGFYLIGTATTTAVAGATATVTFSVPAGKTWNFDCFTVAVNATANNVTAYADANQIWETLPNVIDERTINLLERYSRELEAKTSISVTVETTEAVAKTLTVRVWVIEGIS